MVKLQETSTWPGYLRLQISGVVLDMVSDETGDKMVAVVIPGLRTDSTGLALGIAGSLQVIR